MTCNICVEKYNKSTRCEIKCNFCDFSHCRTCFQKYLLEKNEPFCMNCKKIFTNDFIFQNCTNSFITKDLKKHREDVLLNQQKSFMPATQVYVVFEKDKERLRENIKVIETEKLAIIHELNRKQSKINELQHRINTLGVANPVVVETERKKFIRKCPMTDCRGFLNQQWNCGTCESKICNKCNEEKLDNHECDPGNVANMELLNKDTKPCPECGTMIFRISGCPQMFCVECHCPWNWNTGLVEKGVIHNPHYYDFIRRGGVPGRNHGDIPCGGLPELHQLREMLVSCEHRKLLSNSGVNILYRIHNVVVHIRQHEIRNITELDETTTRHSRISYMLQKMSEENFKKLLQQLEKQKNKKTDFNNIYQMFVDVSSDIFRQLIVFYQNGGEMKNCFIEKLEIFENLKIYFNENIKKCGTSYNCVYPGLTDEYLWEYNYATYLARRRIP